MCGLHIVAEVPAGGLGLHVEARAIAVNRRDGHLDGEFVAFVGVKGERGAQYAAVDNLALPGIALAVHEQAGMEGARELGTEIDLAHLCPTGDDAVALNGAVVHNAYLALDDVIGTLSGVVGLALEGAAVKVEHHGLLLSFGEGVVVDAGAHGGREFNLDAALLQMHHVIAGLCRLGIVAVGLAEIALLQHFWSYLPRNGHQADVDEVGATGTAQMGMGKAVNLVFVVVVTRTGVPSDVVFGFRAQLHHTLWHGSTGEGASAQRPGIVRLCANERIYERCIVVGISGTESHCQQERK